MAGDNNMSHFKTAIRLVVLTQLSSCAVERVFSRLQQIRDSCGDDSCEDITEMRTLMQCNGDLEVLLKDVGGAPQKHDIDRIHSRNAQSRVLSESCV